MISFIQNCKVVCLFDLEVPPTIHNIPTGGLWSRPRRVVRSLVEDVSSVIREQDGATKINFRSSRAYLNPFRLFKYFNSTVLRLSMVMPLTVCQSCPHKPILLIMHRDLLEHGHKLCSARTNLDYQIIFGSKIGITILEFKVFLVPKSIFTDQWPSNLDEELTRRL